MLFRFIRGSLPWLALVAGIVAGFMYASSANQPIAVAFTIPAWVAACAAGATAFLLVGFVVTLVSQTLFGLAYFKLDREAVIEVLVYFREKPLLPFSLFCLVAAAWMWLGVAWAAGVLLAILLGVSIASHRLCIQVIGAVGILAAYPELEIYDPEK